MPYIVNFTDKENKTPITVYDNTFNSDTSLDFPGRNYPGYGNIIAENFLALLENFASSIEPVNPVEGQLWYDSANGILMIWDNTQWKAASNIQKSTSEPSVETSRVGELWVDTTNQQLYVFSGSSWILVGPNFSTGLRSGPVVESVIDSDNLDRVILTFFIDDVPILIISKDSFTPKNAIAGFSSIKTGINITSDDVGVGGFLPKFYGTSNAADFLVVGDAKIAAAKFLRSDTTNTTEQEFNIRNNAGLTLGVDGTFSLTTSTTSAKIYNKTPGSSIDFQTNRDGVADTVLKIINDKVGINIASPDEALDVNGNIRTNGVLKLTNVSDSTNFNNGSLVTAGGVAIGKNLLVGTTLNVTGQTILTSIEPVSNDLYDNGSLTRRWNTVRTKTLIADTIIGALEGNIIGNATTATNLRYPTTFKMEGDVTAASITFDGQSGGPLKTFNTVITSGIISSKLEPSPNRSNPDDYILVFRSGEGLLKQKRDTFVSDLGVPIGTILPYAGAVAPYGYLFCDGGEIEITKYRDLYNVIGNTYGTPTRGAPGLTFVLPDFRGRFGLGKQNMDNGGTVPIVGGFVDAGGHSSDPKTRVDNTQASALGGSGGTDRTSLEVSNMPQHEHDFRAINNSGVKGSNQYHAVRLDTASPPGIEPTAGAFLSRGPTTPGQMQYLPSSGGIKTTGSLGLPVAIMNPYLTINYIIRSGPAIF